ncbi:protein PAT1 homolog 2 isoform X1 [Protopterus annectens]|uniref:protein PAT1 homolog 2 isoform X1 n=1 Tax=Protopterus annectens TaxID=7888 RepID=UPI001CFBCD98|nr:protein PAT1 homolog 2 isoform X1 [Protopterus annectens]
MPRVILEEDGAVFERTERAMMNDTREPRLVEDLLIEEEILLEEMAEEDEDIDLYNEETFGLDVDSADEGQEEKEEQYFSNDFVKRASEMSVSETDKQEHPAADVQVMAAGTRSKTCPTVKVQEPDDEALPETRVESQDEEEEEREQSPSEIAAEELGDPAVMKAGPGKPSLESLDSAILDRGMESPWLPMDAELDQVIAQMVEGSPAGLEFISKDYRGSGSLQHPDIRLSSPRPFNRKLIQQFQRSPMVPRSPAYLPRSFTSPARATPLFSPSQPRGYMSPTPFRPMSPNVSTPIRRPATPKMMQMRFGAASPAPRTPSFYSPSTNTLPRFRVPGHVTQLHPQHRRILYQRQQRAQSAPRKMRDIQFDPYVNLMTPKEKEWVIKVQMIQLQSENPHLDDYYYQAYYEKLERKIAEEEMLGDRLKREPKKLVTPYVQKADAYESVVHIEGSLGQVAVSTCYSPRRAIDAVHAALDEDVKTLGYQKLRVLCRTEKMFMMLLDVEEVERKMSHLPGEEQARFLEKRNNKVHRIYSMLKAAECSKGDEMEDEFLQVLSVGKGKKLVSRLLPYLNHEEAVHILLTIARHLPFLFKKDAQDEALPVLYEPLRIVIGGLSFSEMITVLQEFASPLPDSADLMLTLALHNKFGISFLYALLSHGERLLSSDIPMEPCIGDFEKWTDIIFLVAKELSQLSKDCMVEPLCLPSNLLSLFCRYLDKQTVHKLEDKME